MEFHLNQIVWLPKTSVNVMWTEILSQLKSSGKSQCERNGLFLLFNLIAEKAVLNVSSKCTRTDAFLLRDPPRGHSLIQWEMPADDLSKYSLSHCLLWLSHTDII